MDETNRKGPATGVLYRFGLFVLDRDGFTLFYAQGASKGSIVLVDHLQ
jgi:hypothetical protein